MLSQHDDEVRFAIVATVPREWTASLIDRDPFPTLLNSALISAYFKRIVFGDRRNTDEYRTNHSAGEHRSAALCGRHSQHGLQTEAVGRAMRLCA